MKIQISQLDIFYISYDEPNCEENWADLLNKVPWAKRIHGVKGFDAAHKAAANQSETDRFITVDGDNIVSSNFFDAVLDLPDVDRDGNDLSQSVLSWNGKNVLNGLVYGNGGVKCWPTDYAKTIETHEAATDGEGMEFCWKLNYLQLNDTFSEIHQTTTPYQAFRAGFREGVKLSLDRGKRVPASKFAADIWYGNLNRLAIWCNIGADVPNGLWAIYGARLGCHKTLLEPDWDTNLIADYGWFSTFFGSITQDNLLDSITEVGIMVEEVVPQLVMPRPDAKYSELFKQTYVNPSRLGSTVTEKEVQQMREKGLI